MPHWEKTLAQLTNPNLKPPFIKFWYNIIMKFIRVFLLILIIIGIALLVTQKVWVPKLVNKIIEGEGFPVVTIPAEQPNLVLVDGRQCYTYNQGATTDAPYKVNEFIDITINGKNITGTKTGTQAGPDMTNGYTGTIIGTLDQNIITSVYSYIVEGSSNKEKEIYRTNKTGLEKMRYQLEEEKGMLVPDTTKDFTPLSYARVGCMGSN